MCGGPGSRSRSLRPNSSCLHSSARHPDHVLARRQILKSVWGYDHDPGTNVLGVYVGYLRKKLARSGGPAPIETIRSVGYRLRAGVSR